MDESLLTGRSVPAAAPEGHGRVAPDGAAAGPHGDPRPGARTLALRFGAAVLLVVADLWSKAYVFAWMGTGPEGLVRDAHGHLRFPLVGDWLAWMLSRNPGAAFGGFASVPRLLVGGRVLAVLFLVWLLVRTPPGRRTFGAALVLVLGGALGNLWDNLFEPRPAGRPFGEVRDFIDVYFQFDWVVPLLGRRLAVDWHFPTFNVADSCITVGAILLLLSGLFREGEDRAPGAGDGATRP